MPVYCRVAGGHLENLIRIRNYFGIKGLKTGQGTVDACFSSSCTVLASAQQSHALHLLNGKPSLQQLLSSDQRARHASSEITVLPHADGAVLRTC